MAFQTSNLAKLLINGGVIVYPTETVYGIGGNALDPNVVAKIYQIKQRDPSKPLIILVKDLAMAKKFAHVEEFENILKKYWPGALTGIFQAKEVLPAGVLSDQKNNCPKNFSPRIY